MRTRYLLPCSCGQEIPVESSQAGQEIRCACGALVEVPTLRDLSRLERTPPEPAAVRATSEPGKAAAAKAGRAVRKPTVARPHAKWGPRQRRVFVGAVITAVGLAVATFVYLRRAHLTRMWLPDVQSMSPLGTWRLWHDLRPGVEYRPPWEEHYLKEMAANTRWMVAALAIAAIGALVMASSLLVAKRRPRRPGRGPVPKARAPTRQAAK